MRIKLSHNEFVDFIILFLLERITKEDEIEYSQDAKDFFNTLQRKGMKSYLLQHFFGTDAKTRNKYKFVNDVFNEIDVQNKHELQIIQEEEIEEDDSVYRDIISRTAELVSGKTDLDPEKLEYLQEMVINDIVKNNEEEE